MTTKRQRLRVGVDIGGVIIDGSGDDTMFTDFFLTTPPVEGAIEAVTDLVRRHEVWLISKCGLIVQRKTVAWLRHHDFFSETGLHPSRLIFVRKRVEKAPVARELHLDVMIDDRPDIIESMIDVVPRPILFTSWKDITI